MFKANLPLSRDSYYLPTSASSQQLKKQSSVRSFDEYQEYPTERTMSNDFSMGAYNKMASRTSSDLVSQIRQFVVPTTIYVSKPNVSCSQELNKQTSNETKHMQTKVCSSKDVLMKQTITAIPEEDQQTGNHKRRQSIIVIEYTSPEKGLKFIKDDPEPLEFFEMSMLQQKIWQRLMSMSQKQISDACKLDILINGPHEEYEIRMDIGNIPFTFDVNQLAQTLNKVYIEQKGIKVIKNPQLSMLVGKIKTQRLEHTMKVFELLNLIVNGIKLLVLEEQSK